MLLEGAGVAEQGGRSVPWFARRLGVRVRPVASAGCGWTHFWPEAIFVRLRLLLPWRHRLFAPIGDASGRGRETHATDHAPLGPQGEPLASLPPGPRHDRRPCRCWSKDDRGALHNGLSRSKPIGRWPTRCGAARYFEAQSCPNWGGGWRTSHRQGNTPPLSRASTTWRAAPDHHREHMC